MGVRAALAVHPASGHGRAGRMAGAVAEALRPVVDSLELMTAHTVDESRRLMARARDNGLDLLVVLGGDGAAHQGVQFCADHDVALAVIPAGTGNDLARALGLPADPEAATAAVVRDVRAGHRRRMDLGRVEGGPWFATVLCAGFDSAVNERVNRMRWPHGQRRYDLAILAELAALRARPLTLGTGSADPGTTMTTMATMVAVGNTPYYGGGVPICPDADCADGLFDLTVVGAASRLDLVRVLPRLRRGRHIDHPKVTTRRAGQVRLGERNGWVAYADGERIGPLPVTVSCVPAALTVIGTP